MDPGRAEVTIYQLPGEARFPWLHSYNTANRGINHVELDKVTIYDDFQAVFTRLLPYSP